MYSDENTKVEMAALSNFQLTPFHFSSFIYLLKFSGLFRSYLVFLCTPVFILYADVISSTQQVKVDGSIPLRGPSVHPAVETGTWPIIKLRKEWLPGSWALIVYFRSMPAICGPQYVDIYYYLRYKLDTFLMLDY